MITKRKIVVGVGGVLVGSGWLSGCADPCTDDGLVQQDNGNCPVVTGGGTESSSDTGSDTDADMDADADVDNDGTDGAACDNGLRDGDETDVDCGGSCELACDDGEGCAGHGDCVSDNCGDDGTCQAASCRDETRNGTETDVDCGGGKCDPCTPGQSCEEGPDCNSGACSDENSCLPPSCDDDVINGDETDEDCGGACGATCAPGQDCRTFLDCTALVCDPGDNTCSAPTCEDGAPNGNETDVDCGGADCDPCAIPGSCIEDGDCISGVCDAGQCVPPLCADEELNGDETDVDCGGRVCTPCDDGQMCLDNGDCVSGNCEAGTNTCTPGSCNDGIHNQGESDVDCGGGNCDPCPNGGGCTQDSDCESGACDEPASVCEAVTCGDGIVNGDETDVDCGGPDCAPCGGGQDCRTGTDCASAVCDEGSCADPTCADEAHNGLESDVDCGGGVCPPCADGLDCVLEADCVSMVCLMETCQTASCSDGVRNGDETDLDCGGSCQPCDDGLMCVDNADCDSGTCDPGAMTCTQPACDDNLQNGLETAVDCGGPVCDPCEDMEGCLVGSDCISMVCDPGAMTCTPAACDDGITNGSETDLDCGGVDCGATCDPGEGCIADDDCVSMGCDLDAMTCNDLLSVAASPSCSEYDGVTPVALTAVASGGTGGPYTYAWEPDDGTIVNPNLPVTPVMPDGFASYTVTADDGVATAQDTVVVVNSEPFDLQNNCQLFTADFDAGQGTATISYDMSGTRACETGNNEFGLHICDEVVFSDTRLIGTVEITAQSVDDDWFGLVWGAQDESNFYSLVWKQTSQNFFGCTTPSGVVVKRVEAPNFGAIDPADIYCPNDTAQSELLVEPIDATTAGWDEEQSYTVAIDYTAAGSDITITRDSDSVEIASFAVSDNTFESGAFGSTTLSQENACVGPLFAECL